MVEYFTRHFQTSELTESGVLELPKVNFYYHDDIIRDKSGTAAFIKRIAGALTKNFTVNVFVYGDEPGLSHEADGYRIHRVTRPDIPLLRLARRIPRLRKVYNSLSATSPRLYFEAKRIVEPDIVFCIDSYCAPGVTLLAGFEGKPLVFKPNDCLLDFGLRTFRSDSKFLGVLVIMYAAIVENLTSRRSKLIVAASAKSKSNLAKYYGVSKKTIAWPYGIPADTSSFNASKEEIRLKLGIPYHNRVLIFTGSADWFPNRLAVEYILHTFGPLLAKKAPRGTILIVGQGTEKYARLVESSNTIVVGTVPQIGPYLDLADIGIAPLPTSGGLSTKLVDYLLHGLPCLTTEEAAEPLNPQVGLVSTKMEKFGDAAVELINRDGVSDLRERIRDEATRIYLSDVPRAKIVELLSTLV